MADIGQQLHNLRFHGVQKGFLETTLRAMEEDRRKGYFAPPEDEAIGRLMALLPPSLLSFATNPPLAPGSAYGGTAAGGGVTGGAVTPAQPGQELASRQDITEVKNMLGALFQQLNPPMKKKMSDASTKDAKAALASLSLLEVNGNLLYPLTAPEGGFPRVKEFDPACYRDEKEALLPYADYLEEQLHELGVPMGEKGGFSVNDVHSPGKGLSLSIPVAGKLFNGYANLAVAPYGIKSLDQHSRVVVDLKHTSADKKAYMARQAAGSPGGSPTSNPSPATSPNVASVAKKKRKKHKKKSGRSTEDAADLTQHMPQAIMEFLAAYTLTQHVLLVILTNGRTYTLLELRGRQLIEWENVQPEAALYYTAEWLKKSVKEPCTLDVAKARMQPILEDSLDETVEVIRQLHGLKVDSAFLEQAEVVLGTATSTAEQLALAVELVRSWSTCIGEEGGFQLPGLAKIMQSWESGGHGGSGTPLRESTKSAMYI